MTIQICSSAPASFRGRFSFSARSPLAWIPIRTIRLNNYPQDVCFCKDLLENWYRLIVDLDGMIHLVRLKRQEIGFIDVARKYTFFSVKTLILSNQ